MKAWVYRVLNADAKAWPYHVGNRPEQRNSIKRNLETFRNALTCVYAHQTRSYTGENSLYYLGKYRTNWSHYSDEIAKALIRLGIPTIDCRTADFGKLVRVSLGGPMIALTDAEIDPESSALSYRPLHEVAQGYKEAGCTLFNIAI